MAVNERLLPYLPTPYVGKRLDGEGKTQFDWIDAAEAPASIGHLSAFMGNAGILLRALAYALMLGREGMGRVSDHATLNANYLATRLAELGYELAYPQRRATHEFIITLRQSAKELGVNAMDVAKRLLDHGYHAPTTYFPLLVPEALLIEPTETESKETLDGFIDAMAAILAEANSDPERLRQAPHTLPVRRLDDTRASRHPDLVWQPGSDPTQKPLD